MSDNELQYASAVAQVASEVEAIRAKAIGTKELAKQLENNTDKLIDLREEVVDLKQYLSTLNDSIIQLMMVVREKS